MIKISKKLTFVILIILCIIFVLSLRDIDWDLVQKNENVFQEINPAIAAFIAALFFFIQYVQKLKEESKN